MEPTFFFAWVDAGTAFDPGTHNREDEKVVRWRVEHLEGEFATLSIDIRNPRIGLLNAGRKLWAWLAWDNAGTSVPLFFGRLVALPSNLHREIVTLQFLARPDDYGSQKSVLAAGMRELPYYDPVFIKSEMIDDADIVLEGRTQVWHIDRTAHGVTISDLLVGEDGIAEFQEYEVTYESVEVSLDQPPVRAVAVECEVPWTQSVAGRGLPFLRDWVVYTLAGKGLIAGWPKPTIVVGGASIGSAPNVEIVKGTSLGGGWYAYQASARSPYEKLTDEDFGNWYHRRYALNFNPNPIGVDPPFYLSFVSAHSSTQSSESVSSSSTLFAIINDVVTCNLTLGYEAKRQRKDIIRFTLVADSQPIVTMPDDDDVVPLKITGNDVSLPLAIPNAPPSPPPPAPIGDPQRRSYFTSDRGKQSIQYAIQMARARIVARSRAVTVKWKCKFERAIELSLRKNGLLHDRRLPGGLAMGKITAYSFGADGGEISGECTVACCIGYGGSIDEVPGTPCYVDGYVDGYQHHDGERVVLAASDVGFEPLRENANDDGLVFPLRSVPKWSDPHNVTEYKNPLLPTQPASSSSSSVDDKGNTTSSSVSTSVDTGPYTHWLSGISTTVEFALKAVEGGPFEAIYDVTVTDLKLPKQIDLEAFASGIIGGVIQAKDGTDSVAMAGKVDIGGVVNATDDPDAATLAGTVVTDGTLAAIEATDVAVFTDAVDIGGVLAATDGPDVAVLAGGVMVGGVLGATEAEDVAAMVGDVVTGGALAATEATDVAVFVGNAAVATSYTNPLGSGNRTASIVITTDITLAGAGTMPNLVDGAFGANSTDAIWWPTGQGANRRITFDFGSAKVVDEAKIYASATASMGTWKWQGSNTANGSDWVDLSANFTWAGAVGGAVLGNLSANATAYRYLSIVGQPGTIVATPWNEEFEFKISA